MDKRVGVAGAAVLSLAVFLFVCPPTGWVQSVLIKVPTSRDPALVGTWHGQWRFMDDPQLKERTTTFRQDGTGRTEEKGRSSRFFWGTEGGVLYTKRTATDAWLGSQHRYRFDAERALVTFSRAKMFDLVAYKMNRIADSGHL